MLTHMLSLSLSLSLSLTHTYTHTHTHTHKQKDSRREREGERERERESLCVCVYASCIKEIRELMYSLTITVSHCIFFSRVGGHGMGGMDPFSVGRSDLDPLAGMGMPGAGGGGGMIMDPCYSGGPRFGPEAGGGMFGGPSRGGGIHPGALPPYVLFFLSLFSQLSCVIEKKGREKDNDCKMHRELYVPCF